MESPPSALVVQRRRLSYKAALFLLTLCAIWGLNMVAIKVSNRGFPPLLAAGIRSSGAALLLAAWSSLRATRVWPSRRLLPHAAVLGCLFAGEFVFLYLGTTYTSASRAVVLLYTTPLWTALGAHLLLHGDRLSWAKGFGLCLSFGGILAVFGAPSGSAEPLGWLGDLMEVLAAVFWAFTTVYTKRLLTHHPLRAPQVLFYQLAFSAPVLLALSLALEWGRKDVIWRMDATLSLLHQIVIVAALSYLGWFWLMERYRVSDLSSFSFVTPLFGVVFGGLLLGEALPGMLWLGLAFVAGGIYLANRATGKTEQPADAADQVSKSGQGSPAPEGLEGERPALEGER